MFHTCSICLMKRSNFLYCTLDISLRHRATYIVIDAQWWSYPWGDELGWLFVCIPQSHTVSSSPLTGILLLRLSVCVVGIHPLTRFHVLDNSGLLLPICSCRRIIDIPPWLGQCYGSQYVVVTRGAFSYPVEVTAPTGSWSAEHLRSEVSVSSCPFGFE